MSEDKNDIETKTENDKNNAAGFNSLLLLSLTADAYFKWIPNEGILIRQDMGAFTAIHTFDFSTTDSESVRVAFDHFIESSKFSESARRIFRYFIFVAEDYSLFENDFAPLLAELNKRCEESGIIAEFDIIDLKSGTLKNIDGGKLSDKKIRKVITETITKYKDSLSAGVDSEQAIINKKKEVREKYEELRPIRRKGFINPMTFLIIINIIVFIAGYIMESRTGEDLFKTFGIQDNELIMQGEWWRLITSMFLHADLAHLAGNMLFLFYLGTIMMRYYRDAEFFAVYFISGLCGNLLSFFLTDYRSLGASGAIMGLGGLVIYRMFFGKSAKVFRKSGNYFVFAVMIVFNLMYGVFAVEENIDNYGHFGGFIGGFLVAMVIAYLRKIVENKKNVKDV